TAIGGTPRCRSKRRRSCRSPRPRRAASASTPDSPPSSAPSAIRASARETVFSVPRHAAASGESSGRHRRQGRKPASCAAAALGDVQPGDRITAANVEQVKDLVSPGLEWCIRHGFPITIGESKRLDWPQAFQDATERYSGQVTLASDGLTMLNYVAGLPFPNI